MEAKAAITDGKGNFVIDTIDVTEPETDEVLVEIKAAGVCHTDYDSLTWGPQLIMGHEGAGVVKAVGPNVSHVQPAWRPGHPQLGRALRRLLPVYQWTPKYLL
jgi:S-(hydroxymethyl)glutathione dehydrogenase/alcohol dehydrogenase